MTVGATNVIALQYAIPTDQAKRNIDSLASSFQNFLKANKTLGDVTENLIAKLAKTSTASAVFAGAAVGAGVAISKIVSSAAAYGNELQKISNRTGESVEELSRLQFAAEQEDISLQEVSGSLRIVSRQADAAARGSKEATAAFARLGVNVKDANGNLKSGGTLLREIGEGLAKIPPGTARTAAGMAVLGRSAQAVIPLVTNLKELDAQAQRLGLTVSGKFARDADDFGDKMDQIRAIGRRAGVAIAEALLPVLNKLLDLTITALIPALEAFKKIMDGVSAAIRATGDAFEFLITQGKRTGTAIRLLTEGDLQGALREFTTLRANFSDVKNQADLAGGAFGDFGDGVTAAKSALELLNEQFKAVNPEVAALVKTAEDLGDGFTLVNPQFDALIAKLQILETKSADAGKALSGVLQLREAGAQALDQISAEQTGARIGRGLTTRRVEGPVTREGEAPSGFGAEGGPLQQAPALLEDSASAAEKLQAALLAAELAGEGVNQNLIDGQALLGTITNFAGGFADAFISAAEGGKTAFADFFKGLLKDLARAIVRATILQAILGVFGGGFSIAKIGKQIQSSLGLVGFAHQESSILGRASQARGLEAVAGPSFAGGGTENVMTLAKAPQVIIREPGPFTVVEMTDHGVVPRLRQRQRRLNEEAF